MRSTSFGFVPQDVWGRAYFVAGPSVPLEDYWCAAPYHAAKIRGEARASPSISCPCLSPELSVQDVAILSRVCPALDALMNAPNHRAEELVSSGCVPRLVALMHHDNRHILQSAIRILGNVASAEERETQVGWRPCWCLLAQACAGRVPLVDALASAALHVGCTVVK